MIEFFADDSGKESWTQETYVCIAGYLGTQNLWDQFMTEWETMRLKNNISEIHMKKLIPLQGEYKKLNWDINKRDAVLLECIDIIKRSNIIPFGTVVDIKAWKKITSNKKRLYKVQSLCLTLLMTAVMLYMIKIVPNDLIHIVFDTDHEFSKARLDIFFSIREEVPQMRHFLSSITFADRKIYRPLQAADFLAWVLRKVFVQKARGYKSPIKYQALINGTSQSDIDASVKKFAPQEINDLFSNLETRFQDLI
jgi:hypothetical protein